MKYYSFSTRGPEDLQLNKTFFTKKKKKVALIKGEKISEGSKFPHILSIYTSKPANSLSNDFYPRQRCCGVVSLRTLPMLSGDFPRADYGRCREVALVGSPLVPLALALAPMALSHLGCFVAVLQGATGKKKPPGSTVGQGGTCQPDRGQKRKSKKEVKENKSKGNQKACLHTIFSTQY